MIYMHAVTLSRHAVCESSIHSIKPIKYMKICLLKEGNKIII